MDPSGGRLGTIHSSRSLHQGTGSASKGSGRDGDSSKGSNRPAPARQESLESTDMGMSDPDMMQSFGASNLQNDNFGVSLESLRSFQSGDSNASSWLNQYQSMENVQNGRDPWDDEDAAAQAGADHEGSESSRISEISAPRMVTATGGGN